MNGREGRVSGTSAFVGWSCAKEMVGTSMLKVADGITFDAGGSERVGAEVGTEPADGDEAESDGRKTWLQCGQRTSIPMAASATFIFCAHAD